jgi:hypothetical protein
LGINVPFSRTLKSYVLGRQYKQTMDLSHWAFSPIRASMYYNEVSSWQAYYLPVDVKGKTVLDVDAGEGESAKFFLEHGAKKVVCIEPDSASYRNLLKNTKRFKGIEALNEYFSLQHLTIPHDFLKMDIEGYEEALLQTKLDQPAVIEVHGLQLRDKFKASGYRIEYSSHPDQKEFNCQSYAYWNC